MSNKKEVDRDGYTVLCIHPRWLSLYYKFNSENMRDWLQLTFTSTCSDGRKDYYYNVITLRLFHWFQLKAYVKKFVKPFAIDYVSKCGKYKYPVVLDRTYGAILTSGNFLRVYYGVTHQDDMYRDYAPKQQKSWFLGYGEMRHIRNSILDNNQKPISTITSKTHLRFNDYYVPQQAKIATLHQSQTFKVMDYDGQTITGSYHIYQDEYVRGTGVWKWLGWFTKNKVYTRMNLDFHSEVGSSKGDWKGGMVSISIPIEPGQTPEHALRVWTEVERKKDNRGSRHRVDIHALQVN